MSKTSKLTWAAAATAAIVMVSCLSRTNDPAPQPSAKPAPKVKTKEERQFDFAFDGAKAIRPLMRDPESLKFEYIGVNDAATVGCFIYRAKNGFGGMNKETIVIFNNKASKEAADVKKYCVPPMVDMTSAG